MAAAPRTPRPPDDVPVDVPDDVPDDVQVGVPVGLPVAVRVGLGLCALGMVFILVDVLPFFAGAHDRPLWLNLACLLLPLGLVVAIGSALRRGRRDQREVARALTDAGGTRRT